MSQKRIPTILGLLLLTVGLVVGVLAVQTVQKWQSEATPGFAPDNIRVTNISDQSFTLSWVTEKETTGFVSYGTTSRLGQTAFDNRTSGDSNFISTLHYITLKELQSNTKYFFKVGSGRTLFDNHGQPYTQQTKAVKESIPSTTEPAYGTIKTAAGSPAASVIVYLKYKEDTFSTLTKTDGNWLITLETGKPAGEKIEIFVQGGSQGVASGSSDSSNLKPMPTITLGKMNQNFGVKEETSPVTLEESSNALNSSLAATPSARSTAASTSAALAITVQLTNNQVVTSQNPTFRGTGNPGSIITLRVESTPQIANTVIGDDGSWQWTPREPLENGSHILTITAAGKAPVTRTFRVSAVVSASQSAQSSQSAELELTPQGLPNAGEPWTTIFLLALGVFLFLSGGWGLITGRRGFIRW